MLNLQGDVVAMMNTGGVLSINYTYDPWGKVTSVKDSNGNEVTSASDIANINPILYRGYYFDRETSLYYCQSRYYDPEVGRFLNADSFASTGQGVLGWNMFAYCNNSPVNFKDFSGNNPSRYYMYTTPEQVEALLSCEEPAIAPALQNSGLISGQSNLPYADYHVGLGTYETSGCTYIATYNAMQLIGKPQTLSHVANDYLAWYGTVYYGAAGVAPHSIMLYLEAHDVPYTGSFSSEELTVNVSEGDVFIFTIWNTKGDLTAGWHTMAAIYALGQYRVYNRTNSRTDYKSYYSLNEACEDGAWLYGLQIN